MSAGPSNIFSSVLQPLLKAFLRHLFENFSQEHVPHYLEIIPKTAKLMLLKMDRVFLFCFVFVCFGGGETK